MDVRINQKILREITDVDAERNIYVHPNVVARDIFWQRLEELWKLIERREERTARIMDFGGGSGVFSYSLSRLAKTVEIVDLDAEDARSVQRRFGLENVKIHEQDIRHFRDSGKFDAIVAADVLEHFEDLDLPVSFIKNNLRASGRLYLSLPTENALYEFGRFLVRKQKPVDHYHQSKTVRNRFLDEGFVLERQSFVPVYIVRIPLFEILQLRFPGA